MANVRLQPPDSFDFKKPDEWQRWKRRFEQFRLASALSSESDERQISTLLYCLGPDAEEVLVSTGITTDERKKYNDVVSKFEQFFKVRKNTIFERARFNRRNQQEGESAEQYITVLFGLAENCDYGEFKGQMIRDRLVVGIRDSTLSERLQMDAELTLEKAMKTIRQKEAELFAAVAIANLPASTQRLDVYKSKQQEDSICSKILKYCQQGWPSKREISTEMKPYWVVRNAFTVKQGLIMYNCRIVVPMSLQKETLQKLHQGHQGVERCRLLAQNSVWWPGLYRDIQETVRQCSVCAKLHTPNKEPMIPSALPEYPWQKLGSDLFELQGKHYLLLVDYFSRYVDIVKLTSTTSSAVISAIKSVFSRHGIPELLISDNGPQYVSKEFEEFVEKYNFKHTTSSPHFPQSNGQAERTVQTVKRLLSRSDDPFLALLMYRATPLPWCGYSPAQLLMGRNIRTNIPQVIEHLIPQLPNQKKFRQDDKKYKQQQKANYDCRHRVRELPLLPDDTKVWVTTDDKHVPGTVSTTADTPRSYFVDTPTGTLRRNRADLNMMPNDANVDEPAHRTARSPVQTRSKTGTQVKPPSRFS